MKQTSQHIILLFAAVISLYALSLPSCSNPADHAVRDKLALVDTLLLSDPDAALDTLATLPDSIAHPATAAWHDLLTVKAMSKAHYEYCNDSITQIIAAFYVGKNDSLETQSRYYHAFCLFNKTNYESALIEFNKAYELAVATDDHFYAGLSARMIGNIYSKNYMSREELKWTEQAVEQFAKSQKPSYAEWDKLFLISSFLSANLIDRADSLAIDLEKSELIDNNIFYEELIDNRIYIECKKNAHAEAIKQYNRLIANNITPTSFTSIKIARCYLLTNKPDSAAIILKSASIDLTDRKDSIAFYNVLTSLYARSGDYESAYKFSQKWGYDIADFDQQIFTNPVIKPLIDYHKLQAESEATKKQLLNSRYIMALIALLSVSIIVTLVLLRHKDAKLNAHKITITKLENDVKKIESLQNTISKLSNAVDKNQSETQHLISRLKDNCQQINEILSKGYHRSTVKHDCQSIIELIKSDNMVKTVEYLINISDNDWMTQFRKDFPELPTHYYNAILWLYLGFSNDSLAMLMNRKTIQQIHGLRHSIKSALIKQGNPEIEKILDRLGLSSNTEKHA